MTKGYKPVGNQPVDTSCPSPVNVLANYLQAKDRRTPPGMPADPFQAARWWIDHQKQPDNFTEYSIPPSGKGGQWITPYHDRLLYTLRKFLRIKKAHQMYVIEHVEKGVPWMGDDIDFYIKVVEETIEMHKNPEQYRVNGFVTMKKQLRRMML